MNTKLKRLVLSAGLALVLITPVLSAHADADSAVLTRGEFVKLIADHLKLAPTNKQAALPKDVSSDSTYADTVRIMMERKVLFGYDDGTFRLDQPISKNESSYILGRFLGMNDSTALKQLQSNLGVSFGENDTLTTGIAKKTIEISLTSDQKAIDFLTKASKKMSDVSSLHADMQVKMTISPKSEQAQMESMDAVTTSHLDFNKNEGLYQKVSVEVGTPAGKQTIDMEQYTVTQGTYMNMLDPTTKKMKWFNMTKQIPLTFDQMMNLQKSSLDNSQSFLTPYFFFRDLGTEEMNNTKLHKIEMNGKLTNTQDLLKTLGSISNNNAMMQSLVNSPALTQMAMSLSVTYWYDEQTGMLTKMDAHYLITFGDDKTIPIDHMDMKLTATFKEYNQVKSIVLPEEAKQATEPPMMNKPAQ